MFFVRMVGASLLKGVFPPSVQALEALLGTGGCFLSPHISTRAVTRCLENFNGLWKMRIFGKKWPRVQNYLGYLYTITEWIWDGSKRFSPVYITPRTGRTKGMPLRKPPVLLSWIAHIQLFCWIVCPILFQVYKLLALVVYPPLLATDMDPMQERWAATEKTIFNGIGSKLLTPFT